MKSVKSVRWICIVPFNFWCWLRGHKIKTKDISETMWRDIEHCKCERCKLEYINFGYLKMD